MYLSKSKYCNAIQCNKILWLEQYNKDEKEKNENQSVFDTGIEVGNYAKELFGKHIDIKFNGNLTKMIEETLNVIKNNEKITITEASFSYNNNFCSIDILKKNKDIYEIYEVKSSTEIKEIYLDDIAYQYYILKKLGYTVKKASIVYINNKYERHGELELNKLFIIKDVTDIAKEKLEEVENKIKEINEYMKQSKEPKEEIGMHCVKPYDCPFFKHCTKKLPKNNVFNIRRMRNNTKFNLYHQGIISYEDLLKENIDAMYKEQIEFELYEKKDKINKKEIKKFLDTLSFPLYFLDFETYQQPVPQYDNIKPYQQIPFQFSLHFLNKENETLNHKEYLASPNIDPRRGLAESLVNDIPKNVCVLAYNMTFEKTVIKNLASLYPDLKDSLMSIHDNIKDLMIPFYNRDYYNKDMQGSYSIKYVLPALFKNDESLNYHNLDEIHNGSEAMNAFANMGKLPKDKQEKLRINLLKYCELDTYAMVKIWEKLKSLYN